ncbi:hypothetical protein JCGZ_00514 [Jatropha curcas]|uniref:Uncharacterized protein n=1 Tax=Jatropha curcas TaxID=180498 RepID=A0A067JU32_JATCU|nr:hypothetical protein JCGZ_00514 [Jatropha curcas]
MGEEISGMEWDAWNGFFSSLYRLLKRQDHMLAWHVKKVSKVSCENGRNWLEILTRINFWHGRAEWHGLGVPGSGILENSARAVLSSTLEDGLLARSCAIARAGRARLWKFECNCSTGMRVGTIMVCIFPSGKGVQLSTGWVC